jgi:predicted ferric reductase
MTATSPPVSRPTVHPATTARWVLGAAVVANLVLVEVLFLAFGTGKNAILTVAKFFGLNASLVMMVQLVLIARLPWLDRRIGMDRLTAWHRWVGFGLFWTVLLHFSLIIAGYAALSATTPLATFLSLAGVVASLLGMIAAAIMVVVAATSIRYARRRLSYEAWHAVHFLLYVTLVLGVAHQLLEGTTFPASPIAALYWWTLWALVVLALLVGRIGVPLWRNARHGFRVAAVVPESDDVVSVHVTGRHLEELPARAGQFAIWRFLGHNRWWQANPFSLSAAPDGRSLRLTAKAVGTTSAGLRDVPVGTRVFVEGPYGAFTGIHRVRPSTLLVCGGVGVTPIRALLEEGTGPTVVLYRARTTADAVLLGELQELARSRGAQLHVLTGRTQPGNSPFDPPNLLAMVPDVAEREVYVCGPPAMTVAVVRSLRALEVPTRQVHSELFGLGG